MSKINWTVRLKNKAFWFALIPGLLLLAAQVLKIFGIDFDYAEWTDKILAIVTTIFSILTVMGIVVDPTTEGLSDSQRALTYEEPKSDNDEAIDLNRTSQKGE